MSNPVRFGCFPGGLHKALTLSYDDGFYYDRRLAAIFDANGLRGTFHLNSSNLDKNEKYLTSAELPTLFARHEVSCHALTHPFLQRVPLSSLLQEILDDRRALEQAYGRPVEGLSYPYGAYTDELIGTLRSLGIRYSRTTRATHNFDQPNDFLAWHPTCHHNDGLLDRLEEFKNFNHASRLPVMYVWGHSYEFDRQNNWELIEEFSRRAGELTDTWFATNLDIVNYMDALHRLTFTLDQSVVYNPSAQSVWIELDKTPVEIPGGATVRLS